MNTLSLTSNSKHNPEVQHSLGARSWQAMGIPTGLLAAVMACKTGVKRAHLVDARIDGGLILELYTRDGVGTMISTDFYEARGRHQPALVGKSCRLAVLWPLRMSVLCRAPWPADAGTVPVLCRSPHLDAVFIMGFCDLSCSLQVHCYDNSTEQTTELPRDP